MPPLLLLLLLLLLSAGHAHMTPPTPLPGNNSQQNVKVVVTTGCVSTDDSTDGGQGGPELSLAPGSPLVLTHRIRLLPLAAGAEACGCEANMAALRERLERLEREVSELRERCGGGGGCCSSKEIKGAGCTISSQVSECPNECSDQGRCEDGVCVCFPGFTGDDCSSILCPENCSSRGRCVEGRCVCDEGFSGEDCSTLVCPENCSSRGRCVEGRCVCDEGYTGDDCAALVCPENCSSRGRCVEGRCVCDDGYTGDGCSERVCPKRCSGRGQCVNGSCVCAAGFTGSDCGAKACPAHCSGKGRCVKGKCVCRRGFAEPDCSRCVDGMTGPDCDAEMSGVSELSTRNITESSVTLFWTPPAVNYDTYHVTFDSQKEGDQQISVPVDGGLTSFTQRGLAAGQEYTVTVTGETEGRRGAEASSQFVTLISGPTNLRVVKTTSTSAVVQWEGSQGEIDRYRLSVSPSDGAGKSQELTFQPDQDSAHITELEAGRLYHVRLVAEKGSSHSEPASTHAVPGPEPPSNVVFSDVSENSMTVSWVKPKSPVDGFKVTYTSLDDGEPVSVSLERNHSTLELTQLAPGSAYEVNVISILGLDESDPVRETVATHPDPPSDLRAINVTDTDALLLWRPALAAVDEYTIIYSSGNGSGLRVSVSGNVAQHLLGGLEGSTAYSVTISSLQGGVESRTAAASFTTAASGGAADDGPQDLRASHVTPRTATLSWKPASEPAGSYKLTYQTEGQDAKEVVVGAMTTELNLTRLRPGAEYKVQLQKEGGADIISTAFTTAVLRFPFPTDCSQELLNGILLSGVAEIFPSGESGAPLTVYCDMQTDGGGWTVFQRRKDGSEDFFRGWKEYVRGFGDPSGEFWLGLESIHNLTASGRMMLRVDLRDGDDSAFATYDTFQVARRNYRLTVSGYSGTAGDSLSYHNNRIFSTRDRDPGAFITRCAMSYRGGWWYKNCHQANLNGLYGIDVNHQGLIWTTWKGEDISVTFSEMKMRPAAFAPPVHG